MATLEKKRINTKALKAVKYHAEGLTKEQAVLKAGYAPSSARHEQTRIIDLGEKQIEKLPAKEKRSILDKLGKSRKDLEERVNWIAFEQTRDLSTASKFLAPLMKEELGYDITNSEEKPTQPALNLTIEAVQRNQAPLNRAIEIAPHEEE